MSLLRKKKMAVRSYPSTFLNSENLVLIEIFFKLITDARLYLNGDAAKISDLVKRFFSLKLCRIVNCQAECSLCLVAKFDTSLLKSSSFILHCNHLSTKILR